MNLYDFDGLSKTFETIWIDNRVGELIYKSYNLWGSPVEDNSSGVIIRVCNDGTTKKIINRYP